MMARALTPLWVGETFLKVGTLSTLDIDGRLQMGCILILSSIIRSPHALSSPFLELKVSIIDVPFSVVGLISNGSWDENKIRSMFREDSVIQILSSPTPRDK
ncbi:hypothetical protein LINPERPRIM_LOCUS25071 [Linum perenne]